MFSVTFFLQNLSPHYIDLRALYPFLVRTMRGIASKSVNFEIGSEKDSGAMSGRRSVNESDAENGIEIGIANTKNDPAAMTASVITTESEEGDEINRKHKPNKLY